MNAKSLLIFVFIPVAIVFAQGIGDKVNNRALTPSGPVDPNAIQMPGDAKLLGLNSNAKEFLKSRYTRGASKCVRDPNKAINGLNPQFAECAAKFLQAWEKSGQGRVSITSAYRSVADQRCVCPVAVPGKCASPGRSKHQRGIAIDVHPARGNWAQFHAAARKFGGVYFNLGMTDKPHLVPSNTKCGAGGLSPFGGGDGGYPAFDGGDSNGESQNPGQQGGGDAGGQAGDGYNPYSNQGDNKDLFNDYEQDSSASLTCFPNKVARGEPVSIRWRCEGANTSSRGGATVPNNGFYTQGALFGEVTVRPAVDTKFKIQCLQGYKVASEAMCEVSVFDNQNVIQPDNSRGVDYNERVRPMMFISSVNKRVGWAGETVVYWITKGVDNCFVRGGGDVYFGNRGRFGTGRLYRKTSYTLQCDTPFGSRTVKTTVGIW